MPKTYLCANLTANEMNDVASFKLCVFQAVHLAVYMCLLSWRWFCIPDSLLLLCQQHLEHDEMRLHLTELTVGRLIGSLYNCGWHWFCIYVAQAGRGSVAYVFVHGGAFTQLWPLFHSQWLFQLLLVYGSCAVSCLIAMMGYAGTLQIKRLKFRIHYSYFLSVQVVLMMNENVGV